MKKALGVGVLVAGLGAALGRAAQLSSGADFLKITGDARSAALGEAGTAATKDIYALTWNPAGLAWISTVETGYLNLRYLADVQYHFVGFAVPLHKGDGAAVGAGLIFLGVPSFDSTLGLAPAVSASDQSFFVSGAYHKKKGAIGLTVKYINRRIADVKASTVAGDLAGLLEVAPKFTLGAGFFHVGGKMKFEQEGDPLPATARMGVQYRIVEKAEHQVSLAADQAYLLSAGEYRAGGGLEYGYKGQFFLRGGYGGDHDDRRWAAGAGLDFRSVRLDYAFQPFGDLGDTHRFSVLIRLGRTGEALLPMPQDLSGQKTATGLRLSWKPVEGASGYRLWMKKEDGSWRPLGSKLLNRTAVTLKELKEKERYLFGVEAVDESGRAGRRAQVAWGGEEILQNLPAPRELEARERESGYELSWKAVSGASGYRLLQVDEKGKIVNVLTPKAVGATKLTLKKLKEGKTYFFAVQAVDAQGKEGALSAPVAVKPEAEKIPEKPALELKAKVEGKSIAFEWEAPAGAAGYHLYVSKDGGETFQRLTVKPLTQTKVRLERLTPGKVYLFAVTSLDAEGKESPKVFTDPITLPKP